MVRGTGYVCHGFSVTRVSMHSPHRAPGSPAPATRQGPPSGRRTAPADVRWCSRRSGPPGGCHLTVTVAPAPSRAALAFSAASLATFSRTGFGALSTRSLASLRPSEVRPRTSLMTWIFLSPALSRMTSNSSCSAAASSAPPPPPAAGAAATATGAAAVTSKVSSNCFTKSDSSRRVISLNASSRSEVDSLAMVSPWWSVGAGRGVRGASVGGGVSSSGVRSGGLGGLCGGSLVGSGLLLLQRGSESGDLRQRGLEEPGGLGQVALHRAGQLGEQDLTGLDIGEAGDLGGVDGAALHDATLDDERRVGPREVTDGLGRVDRVALDEGDRGRAVEQRGEVGEPDRVRRPLRQGVLDDGVAAALTEGTAQLGQLGHGQPAVLGEHGRTRVLEPLGDLVDHRGLRLRGHGPPLVCRATTGRCTAASTAPETRNAPAQERTGRGTGDEAHRSNRPPTRVARIPGPSIARGRATTSGLGGTRTRVRDGSVDPITARRNAEGPAVACAAGPRRDPGTATLQGPAPERARRGRRVALLLVHQHVAGAVRVHRDARAHGRGDGDLLEVPALGRRRLGAEDLVEGGGVVLDQLGLVEGRLADHQVQVGLLVDAEVDLPALDVVDGLGDVGRHGAGLRVRHQATGAEDAGDPADLGHLVRRRDRSVEVQETTLDALDQVVGAHDVGAGGLGLSSLVAGREDDDAGGLAGAVGQIDRAADHLVGLARVDTQAHGHLDGGVVGRRRRLLRQGGGLERGVQVVALDLLGRCAELLAVLRHDDSSPRAAGPGRVVRGPARPSHLVTRWNGPAAGSRVEPARRGGAAGFSYYWTVMPID